MNRWLLLLILLLEVMVSRYLTGSAWHLVLIVAAVGVLELAGNVASGWISALALPLAAGVALSGWWAFQEGVAIAVYSPLPWWFHLALGVHLWGWIESRWSKEKEKREGEASLPTLAAPVILAAGALIARSTVMVEIYGAPEWMVRWLGMGVLVLSGIPALSSWSVPEGHPVGVVRTSRAGRGSRIGKWTGMGLGVIGGALLLTFLIRPAQGLAAQLYQWYGDRGEVTRLESFGAKGPTLVSGAGKADGNSRQLPAEADIRLDNTVRFFVEVEEDAVGFARLIRRPVYMRNMTLGLFLSDDRLAPVRRGDWRYDSDDGQEDGRVWLGDAASREEGGEIVSKPGIRYSVLMRKQDMRTLPLMVDSLRVDLSGVYEFADDWYQLALEEEQERVRFSARVQPKRLEDIAGGRPLTVGAQSPEYLDLPGSPLVGSVKSWLSENEISRDGRTLRENLDALRQLLSGRCQYRLRYQNPDGRSPIDNFLFGEKKGHCELFASSTVMLLRTLGIPSRVAYGFCGGVARPKARMLAFRESDFHAWAEIYLAGHGWVIFDTTPAARGPARPPSLAGASRVFAGFDGAAFENLSGDFVFQAVTRRGWLGRIHRALNWVSAYFPGICALLAVGVLILVWRQNRGRVEESGRGDTPRWRSSGGAGGKVPRFLSEYLHACAARGVSKSPGETFLEFSSATKSRGLCGTEFDEMIRYVYGIRYEGLSRDSAAEKRFRDAVRRFRKSASL